jgi:ankyrin repeat protein
LLFVIPSWFIARFVHESRVTSVRNRDLIAAIRAHDSTMVSTLLKDGADPNASAKPAEVTSALQVIRNVFRPSKQTSGPSALMASVEPLLLDPNSNDDLSTPRPEQIEIVKALLKRGAIVNYRDRLGNAALNYAAAWADGREVDILISHGADVNNRNLLGETPLMEAASDGNYSGVMSLLVGRAYVNTQSNSGYTALIYAVQNGDGNAQIVSSLLDHGASVFLKDSAGRTALNLATLNHAGRIVEMLKAAGAR